MASELRDEYDVQILDVTAEIQTSRSAASLSERSEPSSSDGEPPLTPLLRDLVQARIEAYQPDVIAVHVHAAPHLPVAKIVFDAIADRLSRDRHTEIVVGGMGATHVTQAVADWAPVGTWIVRGEGTGRIRDVLALVCGRRVPNASTERVQTVEKQPSPFRRDHRGAPTLLDLAKPGTGGTIQVLDEGVVAGRAGDTLAHRDRSLATRRARALPHPLFEPVEVPYVGRRT